MGWKRFAPTPTNCLRTEAFTETQLTRREPTSSSEMCPLVDGYHIKEEQERDPAVREIKEYLTSGVRPRDPTRVKKVVLQASQFALNNGVLWNSRQGTWVLWHLNNCLKSYSGSLMLASTVVISQGEDCMRRSEQTGGGRQCWQTLRTLPSHAQSV